jgi:proteasome accessory factor C
MPASAPERLQRVLAIVPWIAANDGPTIDEVSERFGVKRDELLEDLDVVFVVGLPPYTPDQLIEVVIDGDRVWIHYADFFARPQRLTPEQGVALLAAGASLAALPGADPEGPLARGVAKLAHALGVEAQEALSIELGDAPAGVLDALRTAVAEHRRVRLDYYTYGRDERTERTVEPYRLHADEGAWYLFGHCQQAGGDRVFRADRISAVEVLDEVFEPPAAIAPPELFRPSDDDPRVTLEIGAEAAWVAEQYPVEEVVETVDGRLRVRLAVTARPWLERLLLRLGPSCTVVDAPDDLARAGADAAARVLERYRS